MSKKSWMVPTVALIATGALGATIALIAADAADESETTTVAVPTTVAERDPAGSTIRRDQPRAVVIEADDVPLGRAEVARVERAALRITGGGTITDIGRSDDPGEAYEVEVLTTAGEIDVALDDNLERVPNLSYDD